MRLEMQVEILGEFGCRVAKRQEHVQKQPCWNSKYDLHP